MVNIVFFWGIFCFYWLASIQYWESEAVSSFKNAAVAHLLNNLLKSRRYPSFAHATFIHHSPFSFFNSGYVPGLRNDFLIFFLSSVSVRVCRRSTPLCHFVEHRWVQTRKRFRTSPSTAWSVRLSMYPRRRCLPLQKQDFTCMALYCCKSFLTASIDFHERKMRKLKRMKKTQLDVCAYVCVCVHEVFFYCTSVSCVGLRAPLEFLL